MQTSHGLPKHPWTSKLEKPSTSCQQLCQSWKSSLAQACIWGKKKEKWSLQPRAWKSWWLCGMKQRHFLTPSQFAKSMALGKEFLLSYKWLNSWSLEKDRNSFAIVIKHHTFIHLLLNSKYMNPRRQWCFRGEDFVGHVSKMAHSISFGVSSTKISTKLCPKSRIFFHLLMTRGLEKPLWVEEDDTF